jgi:hypothetical protein
VDWFFFFFFLQIKAVVTEGINARVIQTTPHLALLSRAFYHTHIKPLLAQWLLLFLRAHRLTSLTDEQLITCVIKGMGNVDADLVRAVEKSVRDEHVKMLNLGYQWLSSMLPFVVGKINRVAFGLLPSSRVSDFYFATSNGYLFYCFEFD